MRRHVEFHVVNNSRFFVAPALPPRRPTFSQSMAEARLGFFVIPLVFGIFWASGGTKHWIKALGNIATDTNYRWVGFFLGKTLGKFEKFLKNTHLSDVYDMIHSTRAVEKDELLLRHGEDAEKRRQMAAEATLLSRFNLGKRSILGLALVKRGCWWNARDGPMAELITAARKKGNR